MSTFTDWNGPQGGSMAALTSAWSEMTTKYTAIESRLNATSNESSKHIDESVGQRGADPHGVIEYVESELAKRNYLSKAEATGYVSKSEAESSNGYLSKADARGYVTKEAGDKDYVRTVDAEGVNGYLSKAEAKDYVTRREADSDEGYLKTSIAKSDYVTREFADSDEGYLTKQSATDGYFPKAIGEANSEAIGEIKHAIEQIDRVVKSGDIPSTTEVDTAVLNAGKAVIKYLTARDTLSTELVNCDAPAGITIDDKICYVLGMFTATAGTVYVQYDDHLKFAANINYAIASDGGLGALDVTTTSTLTRFHIVEGTSVNLENGGPGTKHYYLAVSIDMPDFEAHGKFAYFKDIQIRVGGVNFAHTYEHAGAGQIYHGIYPDTYVPFNGQALAVPNVIYNDGTIGNGTTIDAEKDLESTLGEIRGWHSYELRDEGIIATNVPPRWHACDGSKIEEEYGYMKALLNSENYPLIDNHIICVTGAAR